MFRLTYGPMVRAFAALPLEQHAAMITDLRQLVRRHNRAADRSMVVESDYLEVVIHR